MMHRIMSASLSTASRVPTDAPAASKSPSAIDAPAPAPFSTAIVAPSPANFFTVSGMAATRVSAPTSFRTAIFNRENLIIDDVHHEQSRDEGKGRTIFEQLEEAVVIVEMRRIIHFGGGRVDLVVGHWLIPVLSLLGPGLNKPIAGAQAPFWMPICLKGSFTPFR